MNPLIAIWKLITAFIASCNRRLNQMALDLASGPKAHRAAVDLVDVIIMAVAFFLISYLMPLGINAAIGANTTGWDPTVKTLWTVLWPVMGVLFAIIYFVYRLKDHN